MLGEGGGGVEGYRLRPSQSMSVPEPSPQIEADVRDDRQHNKMKQPKLQGVNGANCHQWE